MGHDGTNWELGFKQYSFHHAFQVLRVCNFSAFSLPPAFPPCSCPLAFRHQVRRLTSGRSSDFPSTCVAIQHALSWRSRTICVLRTAESTIERCYLGHWPWHSPIPPPSHTGSTADRVCRPQSSDGWRDLCDRSAAGCGLRASGGSAQC